MLQAIFPSRPVKPVLTIVCIDTRNHELARFAIQKTIDSIPYHCQVLTFSDKEIYPNEIRVPILPLAGIKDYSEIVLKHLWAYVKTDHFLIVQADGFATNKQAWQDDFLNYDYIGAPWNWLPEGQNVGNGGFSLRSRKLLQALRDPSIQLNAEEELGYAEDYIICQKYRPLLEQKGIVFAPRVVAQRFSYESGTYHLDALGFHRITNVCFFCGSEETEYLLLNTPAKQYKRIDVIDTFYNCIQRGYHQLAIEFFEYIQKERPELNIEQNIKISNGG